MFIRKMLESDWLDYGTSTIYTSPYRRSAPFIRLSIKVKVKDFGKMVENISTEDSEKLVTFGKLSMNFRKLSGKPETIDHHIYSRIFQEFTFSTNFPEHVLNISVRQ